VPPDVKTHIGSALKTVFEPHEKVMYMSNLLAVIGVGFLLGIRHATDPDHVVAVSTIVSRQQSIRHASLIGALWGFGHTLTIFFVGVAIIVFNLVIPPRIGLAMELAVGLMLILLGILNLTGILQWITNRFTPSRNHAGILHSHSHRHEDILDEHVHDPAPKIYPAPGPEGMFPGALQRLGLYHLLRPFIVGLVHGLAGSAAVALLVLTAIHDPHWAILYLLVFGLGTIAGMMLITMIIGTPFAYTIKRFAPINRGLGLASGLVSIAFGLFITFQIGFADGLFTAYPHWTPH
jgi:ABC-type nickel/cobalt efflux system permease component RcnA